MCVFTFYRILAEIFVITGQGDFLKSNSGSFRVILTLYFFLGGGGGEEGGGRSLPFRGSTYNHILQAEKCEKKREIF